MGNGDKGSKREREGDGEEDDEREGEEKWRKPSMRKTEG